MNLRLDALAAAIREDEAAEQEQPKKAPRKRRAPLRPPYQGTVAPTDLDRQKARAALRRMGLS